MMHATKEALARQFDSTSQLSSEYGDDVSNKEDDSASAGDLDELIKQEKKAFRYIEVNKKKRARLSSCLDQAAADSDGNKVNLDLDALCKEVPFDNQIGYNILESLVDDD